MRVGFPGGPRLEWYDRNPISRALEVDSLGTAPHGVTVRDTYTVPEGKKAWAMTLVTSVRRATAAGTEGAVVSRVRVAGVSVLVTKTWSNVANEGAEKEIVQVSYVKAGDTVTWETSDGSTDGTVDFEYARRVTEFDA